MVSDKPLVLLVYVCQVQDSFDDTSPFFEHPGGQIIPDEHYIPELLNGEKCLEDDNVYRKKYPKAVSRLFGA